MCGRFSLFADDDELVSLFDIDLLEGENTPFVRSSWNVAPSQSIVTVMDRMRVVADSGQVVADAREPRAAGERYERRREARHITWGLMPSWAKPDFHPLINARAETITSKPSFRSAASKRRILVPANGSYEWQKNAAAPSGPKQPWWLSAGAGDPLMAFAGIADVRPVGDSWDATCAIITRPAPDAVGEIHDRVPVVVPADLWDAWLDPETTDKDAVDGLLAAIPAPTLVPRKVGRAVGNVRNNGPELLDPVD